MSFKNNIKKGINEILRYMPIKKYVNTPVLYGELLKGRTALITGGTSGIGYEIAKSFLRNGANVVITGRNNKKLEKACEELKKDFSDLIIRGVQLDNCNILEMQSVFDTLTINNSCCIDIFVNNAGVLNKTSFGLASESDWDLVMNSDLKGPYFLTQFVAKYMIDNKIEGNILNVTSSSAIRPGLNSYHFAKNSMMNFTKGLAKELIEHGIVVNGIAPGPTATSMISDDDNISRPASPAKRYCTPEEIANLSTILVSSISRMVIGDTLFATGGCGTITFDD
ncbi:SDR family NAD(P)-dependent oxidoreductase [Acetobacterium woodii]|uniref:3-oxoacyl-[acyl-carrier-protein] reductase FabG3 n=1 Tax=Acetobacterium woodii (strain ATCC 29683 / DSM 1030 / JCM 2381 / KCTC 1655 / WB1) TaxID=931626 RepID=H6LEL2_ACEWD|nr:SDR family oxidoreductase [Acetobacterium woodii]AFA48115.1 3-oxoacyl-[acyl-carrier-protein] reductase FabG3 [Acetobacterium woodii DSM 1030]